MTKFALGLTITFSLTLLISPHVNADSDYFPTTKAKKTKTNKNAKTASNNKYFNSYLNANSAHPALATQTRAPAQAFKEPPVRLVPVSELDKPAEPPTPAPASDSSVPTTVASPGSSPSAPKSDDAPQSK